MKLMVNLSLEQEAVVADRLTDDQIAQIRAISEDIEVVVATSVEQRNRELIDSDALFGEFNPPMFQHAKKLRWVQSIGSGVDHMMYDEFVNSDIVLTSAKGTVGAHLADHAWALLLGVLRGIGRAVRERSWDSRPSIRAESWELGGQTMGIIGLGGTGIEVARRAQGFEMRVIAIDRDDVPKPDFVEEVWTLTRFYDLLGESDVVMICAPLTSETRGMFDDEAFNHMRTHAIVVNVTRGAIIDGPALVKALENGTIGGAGLDVTPEEPLPADHPLWTMRNAIVTPHTAGGSSRRIGRAVDLLCENVRRFLDDRPLVGVIDKQLGY